MNANIIRKLSGLGERKIGGNILRYVLGRITIESRVPTRIIYTYHILYI